MSAATHQPLLQWSDRYSVGIARFDAEHHRLVDMINELWDAIHSNRTQALGPILDKLVTYTITHFSGEEMMMQRHKFPAFAEHKAEHERFAAKAKELQTHFRNGAVDDPQKVLTFLQNWLVNHIMRVDKKYERFLHEHGVH